MLLSDKFKKNIFIKLSINLLNIYLKQKIINSFRINYYKD